jgi:CheY-like chemotaxis protein
MVPQLGVEEGGPMTAPAIDILLAEDSTDLRESMVKTLKDAGYSVEAFANGRDAMEWLHEAAVPPKLLLIDLMMPVMDGWQFLDAQQKTPRDAAIPVVVLSASGSFGGTKKDIPFLRKPVATRPLLAVVARYCEAHPAPTP